MISQTPPVHCRGALEMLQQNFTIYSQVGCPLPNKNALAKTKHTGLLTISIYTVTSLHLPLKSYIPSFVKKPKHPFKRSNIQLYNKASLLNPLAPHQNTPISDRLFCFSPDGNLKQKTNSALLRFQLSDKQRHYLLQVNMGSQTFFLDTALNSKVQYRVGKITQLV